MGVIYKNGEARFDPFVVQGSNPIDTRMVVKAKSDLTTEETWKLEDQVFSDGILTVYSGQVVAVVNNNDSYGDPDNGIWYLKDKYKWNCFEDGDSANIGGWKKISPLPEPPQEPGSYYLTVNTEGGSNTYQWIEDNDSDVLIDDMTIKRLVLNGQDEHTRTEEPDLDNAIFVAKADGGEF